MFTCALNIFNGNFLVRKYEKMMINQWIESGVPVKDQTQTV